MTHQAAEIQNGITWNSVVQHRRPTHKFSDDLQRLHFLHALPFCAGVPPSDTDALECLTSPRAIFVSGPSLIEMLRHSEVTTGQTTAVRGGWKKEKCSGSLHPGPTSVYAVSYQSVRVARFPTRD